jgi:DHA1 family bicyclomycin/chloramphenicol resistance-like MFS transporter
MTISDGTRTIGRRELIGLLAMMMAVTALSVDLMLPAFGEIRAEFGLGPDSTALAGLVTTYLLGLAFAQVFHGVLADRFGRRPIIYTGLAIYIVGAAASALAPTLGWLLAARFLWGIGAAAPRVITLSVVRDTHEGEQMAKVMSFIMAVFILVPVFAPSIGALLTDWFSWRGMFGFTVIAAGVVWLWALRLPETLRPGNRLSLTWSDLTRAGRTVLTTRSTMAYTVALTFLFGAFVSYLATSELIFSDVFERGEQFPIIFGGLASVMGLGMLINGNLVEKIGLRRLIRTVMVFYLIVTSGLVALAVATDGVPGFWWFILGLVLLFACHALLIPNVNTAAMAPMGALAGTASAVIGTLSLAGGAVIGALIDRSFDGTVTPISIAFLACGLGGWVFTRLAEGPSDRLVSTVDVVALDAALRSGSLDHLHPKPGTADSK